MRPTRTLLIFLCLGQQHGVRRFSHAVSDDLATSTVDRGTEIPVIDLSPWVSSSSRPTVDEWKTSGDVTEEQLDVVYQIHRACQEVGFFLIRNHGFNGSVMEQAWTASKGFFGLPLEEKLRHKTTNETQYPYGYEQSETLVRGKQLDNHIDNDGNETDSSEPHWPDWKETFAIGPSNPDSGMPPRRWAESSNLSPDFQSSLEAYYRHMEDLATILLRIFALALGEPITYFQDKMDRHLSALRLVHYYPLLVQPSEGETVKDTEGEGMVVVRAGAHTDYGALTILAANDRGLQILLPSQQGRGIKEEWVSVPVIPGTLIINLGDLMQRWTNDHWVSTLHRVAMPATQAMERRYSMAFFVNVNGDTLIEPLPSCRDGGDDEEIAAKYPVITARQHLMAKHLASMGETTDTNNNSRANVDGATHAHPQREEL